MSRFKTTFRTTDGAKHLFYCESIQALRMLEGGLLAQRATVVSSITHYQLYSSAMGTYEFWQAPYDLDGIGDSEQEKQYA